MVEHIIAAVLLKISYLATGVTLCWLGKDLLEKGITGAFQGEGKVASTNFRLVTSSPGLVFAVAGLLVITTGIVTQAVYRGEQVPARKTSGQSLQALADTIEESRLAQSAVDTQSVDTQFALAKYEASRRSAKGREMPVATAYLVRAVTVMPALLRRALSSEELAEIVADPTFQAIARERFTLPLELEPAAESPAATSLALNCLRLYALRNPQSNGDISSEIAAMPTRAGTESEDASLARFKAILEKNPTALLAAVQDPKYQWLLSNKQILTELQSRLEK